MRIISFKKVREFFEKHSDSEIPLREWHSRTIGSDWKNVSDLKNSFSSADYIGNDHFVFNIKGNSYRLIATIRFDYKMVYVRLICTHAEYDKIKDCSKI